MTVKKLMEKYIAFEKDNYETILISQVINDLRRIYMKRFIPKEEREDERKNLRR